MTSLNKDSTFERESLEEMLSAGKRTGAVNQNSGDEGDESIGGNSRRKANEMA